MVWTLQGVGTRVRGRRYDTEGEEHCPRQG